MRNRQVVDVKSKRKLNVIGNAAVAGAGISDGRFILVLIVDDSEPPEIRELARSHYYLGSGDVKCHWFEIIGHRNTIALSLDFLRPLEVKTYIEFDIAEDGCLVDLILRARGFYLQSGKPGDRVAETLETPRTLIEVGDLGFDEIWDSLWEKGLIKDLRSKGLGRDAKHHAREMISRYRNLEDIRMMASEE